MKRALPATLTLLAAAATVGFYTLAKRDRGAAPAQAALEAERFSATPAGEGALLGLRTAADQPMRSVHFLRPLPDGEVIAQALSQNGEQMLGLFKDGRFDRSLRIPLPEGMPDAFFRFARLEDAIRLDDTSLLLLFTDGTGSGAASWLMEADAKTGESAWAVKAAGTRIAMQPGAMACILWGKDTMGRASWNAEPGFKPLPLPPGIGVLDAVEPLAGGKMLAAHPGGVSLLSHGVWSATPLPDPADLAFPGTPGGLAALGGAAYWQPRPGQLARIKGDGTVEPVDLSKLTMPKGREKDASLLRLAGADTKGRLWFTLATPDLTIAPHPTQAAPSGPSPAMQAITAMNGSAAAPVPPPAPAFDPAAWADYLKDGLDRVYVWAPSTNAPRLIDWKSRWPALGAPPDFTLPLARHLHPEGGALLLDLDTRAWWVPLDKL